MAAHPRAWALFAAALLLAPHGFASGMGLTVLTQIAIAIIACLSYNLLLGEGGMLSFGHAVYTGMGGFAALHALNQLAPHGLPVSLVPLVGGLTGAAVALVFGYFCTRRGGTAFAMITLGLGELVLATVLMLPGVFGGEAGLSGNRVVGAPWWGITFGPPIELYHLVACYTFGAALLMAAFTQTPLGRLLNAVRDNPQRVAYLGYDPRSIRHRAFVVAGFFAGLAGGLGALSLEIVNADAVAAARSGSYLLFTFLGGVGHFFGPVLGAVLMVLSATLLGTVTQAWGVYLGLIFLLAVLVAPQGLAGWLASGAQPEGRAGTAVRSWRARGAHRLGSWLGVLAVGGGTVLLVELLYHWRQGGVLGPVLRMFGLDLDTRDPWPWS
ncbi:MAG: branched-chain amino acid ABC transporter permease, partial [Rhodoferax sp.]|nr:branched-chain amino acid ABC transporter permease [Rhodoferax sp.]